MVGGCCVLTKIHGRPTKTRQEGTTEASTKAVTVGAPSNLAILRGNDGPGAPVASVKSDCCIMSFAEITPHRRFEIVLPKNLIWM
jgi:hypothetical protein